MKYQGLIDREAESEILSAPFNSEALVQKPRSAHTSKVPRRFFT
jgi:hypothetical protein